MDKKVIRDWIFIFIILVVGIYLVQFINSNSGRCLANPLVYGVQQIEKSSKYSFDCRCTSYTPTLLIPLFLDNKSLRQEERQEIKNESSVYSSINWSLYA